MSVLQAQANKLREAIVAIESHKCENEQYLITITFDEKHRQRLTPNFFIGEYMCRDGSTLILIDKRLANGLQRIRDIVRKPVIITSAFRTPEHNKAVGGAQPTLKSKGSHHLYGEAADIVIPGMTPDEVASVARQVGFKGIGVYTGKNNFTHIDVRSVPAEWRG